MYKPQFSRGFICVFLRHHLTAFPLLLFVELRVLFQTGVADKRDFKYSRLKDFGTMRVIFQLKLII